MEIGPVSSSPAVSVPLPSKTDLVKRVALRCLLELALNLAVVAALSPFVATAAGFHLLFQATLVQSAVGLFFHSLGAFFPVFEWVTGASFGFCTGWNVQNLLHEVGHATASLLLYKNPRPVIALHPFEGGVTQYSKTRLSPFGQKIGAPTATFLLTAAGPGLTLAVSSVVLATGFSIREKHPTLSKYLIAWGTLDFVHHAHYAYTALSVAPWSLTHDFARLAIFGVDPLAAAVGLVATPILIGVGVYYWSRPGSPGGANP